MALQSSGPISMLDIKNEFDVYNYGGSSISLSNYYRGGPIVPNHTGTATIPGSGTISLSNFYGTQLQDPGGDGGGE